MMNELMIQQAAAELIENEGGYILANRAGEIYYSSDNNTGELELAAVENLDDLGEWNYDAETGERYDDVSDLPEHLLQYAINYVVEMAQEYAAAAAVLAGLETSSSGTYQIGDQDHHPDCPICGCKAQATDDEPVYQCGHFQGMWTNDWDDANDSLRETLAAEPTHEVVVEFEMGGYLHYFFGRTVLDAVMTVQEIAEAFGIDDGGIRATIARGAIAARKAGGTWLIRRADAEARWGGTKR